MAIFASANRYFTENFRCVPLTLINSAAQGLKDLFEIFDNIEFNPIKQERQKSVARNLTKENEDGRQLLVHLGSC